MKLIYSANILSFYLVLFQFSKVGTLAGLDRAQPSNIKDGDFPFVVSIMQHGLHYCAGSIVTPLFILTAAYCCFDNDGELLPVEDMEVSVGSASWRKGELFAVANVYIHNSYSGMDFQSNVALLKLQRPMMPDDYKSAIILNQNYMDEEDMIIKATVVGWGTITPKGKLASRSTSILTKANLLSITAAKCSYIYKRIFAEEVCMVGESNEGTDTCSGDAGGPLVATVGDITVQIGILSYGADCNEAAPEVYVRVSTYYPWIRSMLEKVRRNAI